MTIPTPEVFIIGAGAVGTALAMNFRGWVFPSRPFIRAAQIAPRPREASREFSGPPGNILPSSATRTSSSSQSVTTPSPRLHEHLPREISCDESRCFCTARSGAFAAARNKGLEYLHHIS